MKLISSNIRFGHRMGSAPSKLRPLKPEEVIRLSNELHKCVEKDQIVKAKFILKDLYIGDKKRIVSRTIDGKAPLFVATQQGQIQFVNYFIEECGADIEQIGVYQDDEPSDRLKHQVTPLWCAAVANKLEVVKTLIKHNADIGAPSETQSTPVRSACFMNNIDVVHYLVANDADINKPNVSGGTCLINSIRNVDLCKFLISKGAKVNAQTSTGDLALHYAIREGRMDSVELLVSYGSSLSLRNDFGDDALQIASLSGHSEILEYLITHMHPSLERQIEAYELIATSFVDDTTDDLQKAIQVWRYAMELRYRDQNNIIYKPKPASPNPAYMNVIEAQDMKELEEIAANPDSVYMQALLIRERILAADHKDTIFGLMYRGAVYADTHRYQRCVDLWKYGIQLEQEKRKPLNDDAWLSRLCNLCKLFWEIYEEYNRGFTNEKVSFDDVLQVLELASKEPLEASKVVDVSPGNIYHQEAFHTMLQLLLHLASMLCCLPKDDEQELEFKKRIHSIVSMGYRESSGSSLLHMAVDKRTSSIADEFYSIFPSVETAMILLECGAEVNVKDDQNNTPLHLCAQAMPDIPQDLRHQMKDLISCLLKYGAHIDVSNKDGIMPYQTLSSVSLELRMLDHITLKCICAQAIKRYSIPYQGEVPKSLIPFIQIHE